MAPRAKRKHQAWNKGLQLVKKDGLTRDQVKRIRRLLSNRGVAGLRDLALFATAIDIMQHGHDLLKLTVGDVQGRNGAIRSLITVGRAPRSRPVRCALSTFTTKALEKWIAASGKKRLDYLFTGRHSGRRPISSRQLSVLFSQWLRDGGLDPSDYSVESLRRTKALLILRGTGDLQVVRTLLGHARIENTARYLGLESKSDPIEIARAFEL
jgi:integrase